MPAISSPINAPDDRAASGRMVRGRGTKHRLMVLAGETSDAIASAGGLIFDRAAAGWDVDIHVPDDACDRPFRILGVKPSPLESGFDVTSQPDCLLIAGSLYEQDRSARRLFQRAARTDRTEVSLWGGGWPRELAPGIGIVEHRLSIAALAFKAEAIKAVGLSSRCARAEAFYSGSYRVDIAAPLLAPA